jgi:hypothetical protein
VVVFLDILGHGKNNNLKMSYVKYGLLKT